MSYSTFDTTPPPLSELEREHLVPSTPASKDRDVLLSLYETTGGDLWSKQHRWKSRKALSKWELVRVNEDGRVFKLYLATNNLQGNLPRGLGKLSALVKLRLESNKLYGPIPEELGDLTALEYLNLTGNMLVGSIPTTLENLQELSVLKLGSNMLSGKIPQYLGSMRVLKLLILERNKLEDCIPKVLGNLHELKVLKLNNNDLCGKIPEELGQLFRLTHLSLSRNRIEGPIPEAFNNLKELRVLDLELNRLTGHIPQGLSGLNNLAILNLEYNDLEETQQEILGQQGSGEDGLGYERYADCLVNLFTNNKTDLLPAAVGIYAPWGSGKSFLLDILKEKLERPAAQVHPFLRWYRHLRNTYTRSLWMVVLFSLFSFLSKCLSCGTKDMSSDDPANCPSTMEAGSGYWPSKSSTNSDSSKKRKFIIVEFNAWECAGSEVLWAALISKMFDKVEDKDEFGRGIMRKKRIQNILKNKSWDWCDTATCFVFIAGLVWVLLLVLQAFDVMPDLSTAWESVAAIVLGVPGALTSLQILYQLRSLGVFHTAQSALVEAADRKQSIGESRLGFMSEVKKELGILFEVINDRNTSKDQRSAGGGFTLAVVIDDLDRCPSNKIMLMLQAVHLLLEQPDAPMAVFLAVDPRIVVSAIEESLAGVSDEVNGLQYLDKIIHIPFCIPGIPEEVRQSYVDHLLNLGGAPELEEGRQREDNLTGTEINLEQERDGAVMQMQVPMTFSACPPPLMAQCSAPMMRRRVTKDGELSHENGEEGEGSESDGTDAEETPDTDDDDNDSVPPPREGPTIIRRGLSREEGEMFNGILLLVEATPRKIKRAINVYALQLLLAPPDLKEREARPRFVKWTMLAEFWPFRLSCIVYSMKADERNTSRQQTSEPSTMRRVYSKAGKDSVRGKIRAFRREMRTKNEHKKSGNKIRDPFAYDYSEDGFLAALGMGKKIPQRQEITEEMVLDPQNGFLRYCLNVNPATVAVADAVMASDSGGS